MPNESKLARLREADQNRRNSILATLAFESGPMTAAALRKDLEMVHGIVDTTTRVRADLQYLAEAGAVLWADDVAVLTEHGRDIVHGRSQLV